MEQEKTDAMHVEWLRRIAEIDQGARQVTLTLSELSHPSLSRAATRRSCAPGRSQRYSVNARVGSLNLPDSALHSNSSSKSNPSGSYARTRICAGCSRGI